MIEEENNNEVKSDYRIYLDLRASSGYTNEAEKLERNDFKISVSIQLKAATTKKLRLRNLAYSLGEYFYILSKKRLTLRHRTYAINEDDEGLLEWEEDRKKNCSMLKKEFGIRKKQNIKDRKVGHFYLE